MDSILTSIKKLLGLEEEYIAFDMDLIIQINMVFSILCQLGAGPEEGFSISDSSAKWTDYIEDMRKLEMIKTYVYLKVKQIFDPPASSSYATAIDNQIKELEWRINVQVCPGEENTNE